MTSYQFSSGSIIDSIVFKEADNGIPRAYLHAGTGATTDELAAVAHMLCEKGYMAIHSMREGKPALEVRGYLFERDIVNILGERGWTEGTPKIEKEKKPPRGWLQAIRDHSLPLASVSFILADIGFTMYGHKSKRPEDTAAGLSYMVGSTTMGLMGMHAQATAEIRHHAKKLLQYAKDHHLDTSNNLTLPIVTEDNKRSVTQKIIDTLQTYPAEIGNSFTALAGTLIAYAAWKYRVKPNMAIPRAQMDESQYTAYSSGVKDMGLGLMTFTSGNIGAWVKEKKHDPDAPPAEGLGKFWEWVQEKPLRVAGIGYMISTGFHTLSTWQEYHHARKINDRATLGALPGRMLFIGSTIVAEILLAISSKGHGDGVKSDPSTDESVLSLAAEMIVQQKPELQAELVDNIGGFLGRADVLGGKDTDIKERLAGHVEAMRRNPWLQAVETVKKQPLPSAEELPAWQAKVAAAAPVPPVLGA
ncbi:MAG: hypothetical protein SFX19_04925 [Alphaproteobacteria bacterium]|nr:hypothetical protein [Alphaproteobacteria bacterium]